ncbi:MAG: S-methyl-5-thioribose-1-phosphate isomerase [Desulfovibrionaceae bacterium]|nr:S-methyl-5-thioribose-1-phosphate isomerase [Desulfovibrionaceae bacterium]
MHNHIYFTTKDHSLHLLDQRLLPTREEFFVCRTSEEIITALQVMVVRGAPAIGVTAAWGCIIALHEVMQQPQWAVLLHEKLDRLAHARPTAVNLRWAVEHLRGLWAGRGDIPPAELLPLWEYEAAAMQADDIKACQTMGQYGAACIQDGDTVMTHCNAGALATAGYGTALGVIRAAWEAGKKIKVIANETRPFLQGARLTAYELAQDGIPVSVACDNACALLMQRGMVQCVVVGADRIAANGDSANKIGTYGVALLAHEHHIPFYIAAPLSTIDLTIMSGAGIPIEERPAQEVSHIGGTQITPDNVPVFNFAFDVTPARLIAGIITEEGVLRPPYTESIAAAFERQAKK